MRPPRHNATMYLSPNWDCNKNHSNQTAFKICRSPSQKLISSLTKCQSRRCVCPGSYRFNATIEYRTVVEDTLSVVDDRQLHSLPIHLYQVAGTAAQSLFNLLCSHANLVLHSMEWIAVPVLSAFNWLGSHANLDQIHLTRWADFHKSTTLSMEPPSVAFQLSLT